jgi:hypothetical protein
MSQTSQYFLQLETEIRPNCINYRKPILITSFYLFQVFDTFERRTQTSTIKGEIQSGQN